MEQKLSKKIFHITMLIIIIVAILFTLGILILRYEVEGETNLPFNISKITTISSIDASSNEDGVNRWNLNINQNNDIYLYIEKNSNYEETEVIRNIVLNNFVITSGAEEKEINIYKPSGQDNSVFVNSDENIASEIIYTGDLETNIQNQLVGNQGGLIVFRIANNNIANYISNEGEELNYNTLLKSTELTQEDLQATIDFNLTIELESNKSYQATISINIPVGDIIEESPQSLENTNLENIVFKRVENN